MFSVIFWLLALCLSIGLLFEKNLKTSILFFGLFGTITSGAYLFMGAPDVSFASLALGAGFTTFVFLIAIRKTGTVRVKYILTPYMVFKNPDDNLTGFEYELLKAFLLEQNLEAEYTPFVLDRIDRKETDILIGGIFDIKKMNIDEKKWLKVEVLNTKIFKDDSSEEIDLVRIKKEILKKGMPSESFKYLKESQYLFLIEHHRPELADDLRQFIKELKNSGEFEDMVRRYIG
ncbi:MAG TPA: DUF4040 domain-containing protein [Bacteroidales bacterium]|nr:DUF4040 domain-containing protein [Bacteroidales bacterium]HRW33508.1 DUF4040 domain-containing protein [Thermotogota bacterium]